MSVPDMPTGSEVAILAVQVYIVPFAAYVVGIVVRNLYLPEPASPSLRSLMILGLPIYLVVVCPILMTAEQNLVNLGYGYLLTIGIVMEHGMIVHETAISRISQLIRDQVPPEPTPIRRASRPRAHLADRAS